MALAHLRRVVTTFSSPIGLPAGLRLQPPLSLLVPDGVHLGSQGVDFALRWDAVVSAVGILLLEHDAGALSEYEDGLGQSSSSTVAAQPFSTLRITFE